MLTAIIGTMEVRVVAVRLGSPTVVDALLAGVRLQAEWVGRPARAGDLVDVELDVDDPLKWADTIATAAAEPALREGPRLYGTIESHDQQILTMRIADGLVQVEVDGGPAHIAPGTAVVIVVGHLKLYPTDT